MTKYGKTKNKTWELIKNIEKHLPISVYPSPELYPLLGKYGLKINSGTKLTITRVFNSGDDGGIVCSFEQDDNVFVVSVTHLRFDLNHPLHDEILSYQKNRIKQLH